MMVDLETRLAAPPDRVWAEVQTSRLLRHIARPLVHFQALDPKELPERWRPGKYRVFMWCFYILPFGRQWIDINEPPAPEGEPDRENTRCIRDNGTGDFVRVWDHWIFIRPDGAGGTIYRDRVEVKAGLLTPFVWAFAQWFYRHRQARWRALVARDFDYAKR